VEVADATGKTALVDTGAGPPQAKINNTTKSSAAFMRNSFSPLPSLPSIGTCRF
jgi:hypothetical protein